MDASGGSSFLEGVNIAGAEQDYPTLSDEYNYAYPQDQEISYFASKGFGLDPYAHHDAATATDPVRSARPGCSTRS